MKVDENWGKKMSIGIPKVKLDETARLKSSDFNIATSKKHMENEIRYSFYNHGNILKAFKEGRAMDLSKAPKAEKESILIIGSGSTLDAEWPLIKKWEGPIMVSTSQATTAIYYGKEPDYIIALDPDTPPDEFKVDTWKGRKCALIIHPGIMPETYQFWEGPLYMFRKLQPQTPFYSGVQRIGYQTLGSKKGTAYANKDVETLITSEIPMLACVLAAQICIARQLGYKRLFLIGADLSYPENKERFLRWDYREGEWKSYDAGPPIARTENVYHSPTQSIDGLITSQMFVFYAHQIITAWRITQLDVINTSDKGLMKVFPYCPLDIIVKCQGENIKSFNLIKRTEVAEEYLARQNIFFVIVGKAGLMPHEFSDPITEIPKLLNKLKEALTAQGKGVDLDIEKNMERFNKLFKKVTTKALKPDMPITEKPITEKPTIKIAEVARDGKLKQIAWNVIKIMGKTEKREFDIGIIIKTINQHVKDLTFIETNIVIKEIRQYEKKVEINAA